MVVHEVYSNSLLATLNARKGIRAKADDSESLSLSLQTLSKSIPRNLNSNVGVFSGFEVVDFLTPCTAGN